MTFSTRLPPHGEENAAQMPAGAPRVSSSILGPVDPLSMKPVLLPLLLGATLLAPGSSDLEVTETAENVVSSRLEGVWVLDGGLTSRLRAKEVEGGHRRLVFELDRERVVDVPESMRDFLADQELYAAGVFEQWGAESPFVLTMLNGNPHLIAFEPDGGLESFNLALVPALLPEDDLLFVGGDFNDQPFDAFRRAPVGSRR